MKTAYIYGLKKPAGRYLACALALLLFSSLPAIGAQDSRDRYHQPDKVMDLMGIKAGMVIGEVGAGSGYFTFHLALRVRESGKGSPTSRPSSESWMIRSSRRVWIWYLS